MAEAAPPRWANNIVGYSTADPATLVPHPHNWRKHGPEQLAALEGSLDELGWIQDVVINETTGHLLDGHARVEKALERGEPSVPVKYVRLTEEQELLALLTLDPISSMATAHAAHLQTLVERVRTQNAALQGVVSMLAANHRMIPPGHLDSQHHTHERADRVATTFDMIYTHNGASMTAGYCCAAVTYGWGYGIQSGLPGKVRRLCPWSAPDNRHRVLFLDNDYRQYDHAHHLARCREVRPKYATVRDIMTEQQCAEAGIAYFPLDEILAFAKEVATCAERVIVIPKYNCLDAIPAEYVLGYSIPTSHGGTPLPFEAFLGHEVHLLGGSWQQQLGLLERFPSTMVSADNNAIYLQARYGVYVKSDGSRANLRPMVGDVLLPVMLSIVLSFDAITRRLCELYPAHKGRIETPPQELDPDANPRQSSEDVSAA